MALINSAILAAGAMAIALPLGALLAILLARYDLPGRRGAAACRPGPATTAPGRQRSDVANQPGTPA